MSEELRRTLDAQRRHLDDIDAMADDLLAGKDVEVPAVPAVPAVGERTFDDVVAVNDILRADRGWEELLRPPPAGSPLRREWTSSDLAAVGLAGVLGFTAAWFDASTDSWVRERLNGLRETELIQRWEKEAKLYALDYGRNGYGGPNHRVRSSGHDLLRVVAALRQIRTGNFEGVKWVAGKQVREVISVAAGVDSLPEALLLWLKHLVTDVITPTSLPLPGLTLLNEMPWPDAQLLARRLYMGERDGMPGLTLRGGVLQTLPLLVTEVLVRTHVHLRAWSERGTLILLPEERALLDEMLLVGHGITGAASLGRTLATAIASPGPNRVLAVRHLNLPVLTRTAILGLSVARARRDQLPEWDSLLDHLEAPWDLELAAEIEAAVAAAL